MNLDWPGLSFTVYGEAQPKGSTRAFVPKGWTRAIVTSDNPQLKSWEDCIRGKLQEVMARTERDVLDTLFSAPVCVSLVFYRRRPKSAPKRVTAPTTKPDLDELVRGAIDALSGVLFHDDAQVTAITASKVFAESCAKLDITVTKALP